MVRGRLRRLPGTCGAGFFHGFCGACGEESWDLQQMQLQRVTVLYRQNAGHGVVFFRVLYTMTIYTFRILACS